MQGFPDPRNAWKKNPGGFEEPDPDDICPDWMIWPKKEKPPRLRPPYIPPEIQLLDTWDTRRFPIEDSAWRSVGPIDISGEMLQV